MSNIIGVRNNSTIVPYVGATKRTKQVTLTVTSAQTIASQSGSGYAYADSAGVWRLVFNIIVTYQSNQQNDTLTISGVQVKYSNSIRQAVTINNVGGPPQAQYAYADYPSPHGIFFNQGTATANVSLSGDIELESEPTWAAANMEGVTAADVYIAPASTSSAGLVKQPRYSEISATPENNSWSFSSGNKMDTSVTLSDSIASGLITIDNTSTKITANARCSLSVNWAIACDTQGVFAYISKGAADDRFILGNMAYAANAVSTVNGTIILQSGEYIYFNMSAGSPRAVTDQWPIRLYAIELFQ